MKLLEILLYVTLFAFIFSGYVLFTQNFAHYIQVNMNERKIFEKERLMYEYVRWNVHRTKLIKTPTLEATSTVLILQKENDDVVEIGQKDLERFLDDKKIKDLQFFIENNYLIIRFSIDGMHREVEIYLLRLF